LDDLSSEAQTQWIAHLRRTLRRLPREVPFPELSRDGQIDFEILRGELTRRLWLAENTRPFEEDPRVYNSYINDSVYLLLTQSTLPTETNIANVLSRMAQIPRITEQARANLTRPPRAHTETAIRQNRGAIDFYSGPLYELAGDSPRRDELRAAAQPVLEALQRYQQFLEEELLPRADGDWRLGRRKFARKLELVLDAGMSADEILADAEAEHRR